jgi:hypothetical protein
VSQTTDPGHGSEEHRSANYNPAIRTSGMLSHRMACPLRGSRASASPKESQPLLIPFESAVRRSFLTAVSVRRLAQGRRSPTQGTPGPRIRHRAKKRVGRVKW